jgi:hypothetical protein
MIDHEGGVRMNTRFAAKTDLGKCDPRAVREIHDGRWASGRIVTDLGLIALGVGIGLNYLAAMDVPNPPDSIDRAFLGYGIVLLGARVLGILLRALKAVNDACERACDLYWPMTNRSRRKPTPLDDF